MALDDVRRRELLLHALPQSGRHARPDEQPHRVVAVQREVRIVDDVAQHRPRVGHHGDAVLPQFVHEAVGPQTTGQRDARTADEGRSFLSKRGGGNKLGEQVYDPRVNIFADPWHEEAPVMPWDEEGLPRERLPFVENGKIANLDYSRFWAQQQGKRAVGRPGNLLMSGGEGTTADLIRGTDRGILVTRTWYIRMVDPQTVLLTGLTRDGTFYIENGRIVHPVKNFRFNESPVIMLNNIDELGRPVLVSGDESSFAMLLPPMRLRDFTFSSLSDAV